MSKEQKDNKKIKEFEWYQVETKVREIMSELLQPFNKKQTEDTIKMNEIKRVQATSLKKLEDHDFLLQRQQAQKPTYVQLQDDKISEMDKKINEIHIDTHASIKRMETIIAVYQEKINQLNDLEKRVDKEVVQRVNQFSKFKESTQSEVELMIKRQNNQIEEVNQFKNMIKGSVSKMENRMITFDNRLKELQDEHRHRTSDIKKLMEDVTLHNQRITKLDYKTDNLTVRVEDREKDTKLSQKFLTKVKEIEGDMRFQVTFLEQYQPLYIQMMISDSLDSFLEGKQRRKLCIFQQKLYSKLHHHILINQKRSLSDQMASYSNSIRKIINRNKKYVIHLAVAQTIKHGGNIYQFRIQNLADIQDQDLKNKNIVPTIDPQQIALIVDEKIGAIHNQVKQIVFQQLKPTKAWINQLQQQTIMRSLQYDQKYESIKKKIADIDVKQELAQKFTSKEMLSLSNKQDQLEVIVHSCRDYVKDILNFSSVMNHIVIQDQIDRQGTALYALKNHKKEQTPAPTFQLDPNCLNCQNKTSTIIQQAFKMACLTYNPSQIKIEEQLFSREEILQISTSILEKLKKKLWVDPSKVTEDHHFKRNVDQISSGSKAESKRKSFSTLKDQSLSRQTARDKQYRTLLPNLGGQQKPRKTNISVFY